MDKKYVVLNEAFPIVFIGVEHSVFTQLGKVTSAGFCRIVDGKVEVFGHSHSLQMEPEPFDAMLIQHMLFGG